MKGAGMCCGRFCGVGFGMEDCWVRSSRSCMRWCLRCGMRCRLAYPELLVETAERVAKVVLAEEEQFARVMEAVWVQKLDQLDSKRSQYAQTDHAYYSRFQIRRRRWSFARKIGCKKGRTQSCSRYAAAHDFQGRFEDSFLLRSTDTPGGLTGPLFQPPCLIRFAH